jgi:hypothetical protein
MPNMVKEPEKLKKMRIPAVFDCDYVTMGKLKGKGRIL